MKTYLKFLIVLAALAFPALAHAQTATNATPTQQTSTRLDASTYDQTASGTAQQTLQLTCPSGQYVYLVSYDEEDSATTAPAVTLLTTTTTNLGGKKFYKLMPASATGAHTAYAPGTPLKGTTNTATIVSNAAVTNVTFSMDVSYYCAP